MLHVSAVRHATLRVIVAGNRSKTGGVITNGVT
jgi:hypothetical protein